MKHTTKTHTIKRDRDGLTRCRVCSCSQVQACNPPCSWADQDLCSNCAETVQALMEWTDGAYRANKTALWRELERAFEDEALLGPGPRAKAAHP